MFLSKLKVDSIRTLLDSIGIPSDDYVYRRHFKATIARHIYAKHLNSNYISCAFCSHLARSSCLSFRFTCSVLTYSGSAPILPCIFTYYDKGFDSYEEGFSPWIYRTPCINFERLDEDKYFKNFIFPNQTATITNFEILEGMFLGISNGKRPCHLCASVDIETYNRCVDSRKAFESKPCHKIVNEISAKYLAYSIKIKNAG